jgi:hypothetical protein
MELYDEASKSSILGHSQGYDILIVENTIPGLDASPKSYY